MPRPRLCVAAVACVLAVTALAAPARADTTEQRIERTRAAIDDVAQGWFDSQAEAARLDAQIDALEQQVADGRAEADRLAELASTQAIELYTGSVTAMAPVLDGTDALDTARRAELLDRADDDARQAIAALDATTEDLEARRDKLASKFEAQAALAGDLYDQQVSLDAQLVDLKEQAARDEAAEADARDEARRSQPTRPTRSPAPAAAATPAPAAAPESAVTTPSTTAAPSTFAAPADTGGIHPRHDEPFLACTRDRESSGDYTVVNPDGYYGAYQFLPTTWDVTASRANRLDLVGVLPSHASQYDQDELAWTLYEWQGNRPWNGRC